MSDFETDKYLKGSADETYSTERSFGVTALPRAPAQGTALDTIGAVFRQDNIIVSSLMDKLRRHDRYQVDDPNFNPMEHIPPGHLMFSANYLDAKNLDDIRDRFYQVEAEIRDRQLYAQRPIQSFFTSFIASNADPTILFPGTLFYKNFQKQLSVAKQAVGTGGAMGLQTGLQEFTLRETQMTRTIEESATNIVAATALGSMAGAFSGYFLNSPSGKSAINQTSQIFNNGNITPPGIGPGPAKPKKPGGGGSGGYGTSGAPMKPGEAGYPVTDNALHPVDAPQLALPGGDKLTSYSSEKFHGTSKEITEFQNIEERETPKTELSFGSISVPGSPTETRKMTSNNTAIYGHGLYTTSEIEAARRYTKKGIRGAKARGEAAPTVYKIEERFAVPLKDMDKPYLQDPELKGVVESILATPSREHPSWVNQVLANLEGKIHETFTDVIDEFRRAGVRSKIQSGEYQDWLKQNVMYPLAKLGYRGFTHIGGILTKGRRHKVAIYWYPKEDLNIFKVEQEVGAGGGGSGLPPEQTSVGFTPPGGKSVGAANVMESALIGQALKMGKKTAKAFGTTLAQMTPSGRLATSPLGYMRLAGETIFENNWRYQKNYSIRDEEGQEKGWRPNKFALETLIKRDMGKVTSLLMKLDNIYFKQRGIQDTEKLKIEKDFFTKKGLEREEFETAAFFDVINGFVDSREGVGEAAKLIHEFFDEWKDKYTDLKVFPEGMTVRNSINYFTHYYNVPWIQDPRNTPQAEQILTDFFRLCNGLVEQNLDDIKAYKKDLKDTERLLRTQVKKQKELDSLKEKLSAMGTIKTSQVDQLKKLREKIKALEDELALKPIKDIQDAIKKAKEDFRARMPEEIFDADWNPRSVVYDEDEIWVNVQNTLENIMNLNMGRFSNQYLGKMGIGTKPRPTNSRTLLIPTEQIAPMLITSWRKVLPMFARSMIPNYHITKFAQEMGFDEPSEDVDIQGASTNVMGGFMGMAKQELEERLKGANPKQSKELYDSLGKGQADIKAGLELLLGTFGNGYNTHDNSFNKFLKFMSAYNYTKMMGYMVVSALTDPGYITLRNGFAAMVYQGIVPIINQLKSAKHNKVFLQSLGRSLETYNGFRLKALADQNDLVGSPGKISKVFDYLVTGYGNTTGMSQWTDLMQWVAGNTYLGQLLHDTIGYAKNIKEYEKLQAKKDTLNKDPIKNADAIREIEKQMAEFQALPDEKRSKYLALGLSDQDLKVLHEQWSKIGGLDDGVYWIDWGAWDVSTKEGVDALGNFQAALINELDSTIIIPGLGDKPLFARTPIGNAMLMFKGFGFGATSRVFVSGLTHADANFYNGAVMLMFLGAMTYVISSLLKGKEIDSSLKNLAFEAIDRSGLLGVLMEVPLTLQKMGLLPGVGTSRYQSRDWVGAMGGPVLGTVSDWVSILNKIKNADEEPLTTKTSNKVWKQFPVNNVWYLDGLNRNLGITDEFAKSLGFEEAD